MSGTKELTRALLQTSLFGAVSAQDLEPLIEQSRLVECEAGEILFSAGDPSRGLYLVLSGRTRAYRHGPDAREQVIHEDPPGSTFPEVAVFDGEPYPSTVVAVERSRLLFLPSRLVLQFCLDHPEVALSALRSLSSRLRRATGMVEGFALRDVSQRLAEYLLKEWNRLGDRDPFQLRHSNQEIADSIGTVREVVSRSFAKLQRMGWIRKEARAVEILDPTALQEHAEGF